MKNKMLKLIKSWEFVLLLILVLEFVVFGSINNKYLQPVRIFSNITNYISICIISLFVTIVMITGGIDIQASSIVGLTSITIGVLWNDFGFNIWAAVGTAVLLAVLCGALSGFFVAYCGVQPMVVTLGGSFLYSGLGLVISRMSAIPAYQGISGFPSKNDNGTYSSFRWLGNAKLFGSWKFPIQILIFIILVIILYIILHETKYGRSIFLIGVNSQAAEYSGINTRLIEMSTYMLTGFGASIAGILLTSQLNSSKYDLGSTYTLSIITAVVLGGTLSTGGKGSIIGTALASLVICMLRFGLSLCFGISSQNLDLSVGVMLLVVVSGRQLLRIILHLDS